MGERTSVLSADLIEEQLGAPPVQVSVPVHRDMVRRCFEIAVSSGSEFLVVVDADVLVYPNAIDNLLSLAHSVPLDFFSVVPRIDDHLFGRVRVGGLRLYRVAHLALALELLPSSSSVRPESGLMPLMAERGHRTALGDLVVGVHDAEQYLRDVHRKAAFYAHRNVDLIPDLLRRWRDPANRAQEQEFRAALLGLSLGIATSEVGPDFRDHLTDVAQEHLKAHGLVERAEIGQEDGRAILSAMPRSRRVDSWVTLPPPASLQGRLAESRRRGRPVWRGVMRASLQRALRAIGDPDSRGAGDATNR